VRRLNLAWLGLAGLLVAGCGALTRPVSPGPSAAALALTSATTQTPEPVLASGASAPAALATAVPTPAEPTPAIVVAPLIAASTPTPLGPVATLNPNLALTVPPTEPPTPDPDQDVGAVLYADEFNGENGWRWPSVEDDIAAFSLGGNRLNAVMKVGNLAGGRTVAGQPSLQISDQQLQVTSLTSLCYAKDEYGVLFRANAAATDGYLFKLSCEGRARVEALHNLRPAVLVDWTASPAIMPGAPAENTLLVWAGRDQLQFFVNGKYLFSVVDKTYVQGTYGFYIFDRSSGGESVGFGHLVVKAVSLP
jgi:hypothetical protein